MTAIITEQLKRNLIGYIFADLEDSAGAKYYIGIGRSEPWDDSSDTEINPVNTEREVRKLRSSLQAMKRVASYSFVVPRYNWSSGTVYSGYNDNISSHPTTPYYVITEEYGVYICIEGAKTAAGVPLPSTVQPTGTLSTPYKTSDGYVWKFLYTVGTLSATRFLSANYMPVRLQGATDGNSLAVEIEQETVQNAAVKGQIAGVAVVGGGTGYTSAPTATLKGNGSGITVLDAEVVSGSVTRVTLLDDGSGGVVQGTGWDYGTVVFSGGGATTTATARPILGPKNGFGADPRIDLRSKAIMFNIKPTGDEEGEFLDAASFRQIAVIRNPGIDSDANPFVAQAGNALTQMYVPGHTMVDHAGATMTSVGTGGTARGIIDKDSGDYIWYHQTEVTGYIPFENGKSVSDDQGGSGTITTAQIAPSVNPFSGEVLYIESRARIQREASPPSTEDIKVIIEL